MSVRVLSVVFALFLTSLPRPAAAEPFVYVVTLNQQFGVIDLATGAFRPIGAPTPEPQANLVWLGNSLLSLSASGNLVAIDPATGATTVIGPTGLGYDAFDLASVRGRLYATDFQNNLYSVDPHTGAATLVRATGIVLDPNVPFTVNADGTLNLCDESLYGFGGKLYATFDSFSIDPNPADPNYLGLNTFVQPLLYEIDPATGVARTIGPTELQIGASVEVDGRFYGFTGVITGFAGGFPVAYSQLVSIDLHTGQTTFIRNIDPAAAVIFGAAPARGRSDEGRR